MAGHEGGEKAKRKVPNATAAAAHAQDPQAHGGNPAPAKRQRVSRACDQCRTAREKCDGIQPICFTCASSNRDCTYTANPKKRGIQPGYIRTLELALAWTFGNVPGSEDALVQMLAQPEGRSLLSGKDTEGSYTLHRKWRKSAFCKDIDRVLSGADPVSVGEKPTSPNSPDDDQLDDADGASVIAATPVAAASSLNGNAHIHRPPSQGEDGARLLPGDIYDTARSLIPAEQGSHEVGHVKALLLLALINIGANMSRAAWLLIGYAARLSFVLGLHNTFPTQGRFHGSEDQNPRGKHVFLACFALDTIVSAHLGREPFMRREHVDRIGLIAEDGLEEWHPWVGCPDFKPSTSNPAQYNRSPVHTISTFNHIVRILTIVNDVSLELFGNSDEWNRFKKSSVSITHLAIPDFGVDSV
ncbi:hypothetical protein SLS56_011303 [Neofusicoccum ribis]|uniref:Zn(2)-C6 fungal-type domain-containing protein n=1 Tax=Neofusicoccum ribis TaxID=45134 RepID=A0ABR3SCY3_9PEZI